MGEREEIERLYQQLGGSFKALYPWQIYVLTSSDRFDRLYGQRADKVKKLYNGMLPCYLYEYFKPAEARGEDRRTAKEIFDRKPDHRRQDEPRDRHFDRQSDRQSDRRFDSRDNRYGPRSLRQDGENRPNPPKKKQF